MIKDNQRILNRIHVLMDAVMLVTAYVAAWIIKFKILDKNVTEVGVLPRQDYFQLLSIILPIYLIIFYRCGMYMSKRQATTFREIFNIVRGCSFGLLLFAAALYVLKITDISRGMIGMFFGFSIGLEIVSRLMIRSILRSIRRKGYNVKYVLLIGYSRAAETYIRRIDENPQWGYEVRGILDDHIPAGTMYKGIKVLGKIDNIHIILPENKIDEIAITLALKDYERLEELVTICEKSGVHTKFIPDYNSVIPTKPYIEELSGLAVVNIRYVPLSNTWNMFVKRLADIIGSLLCIIFFSPIMLISAIMIKCCDGGKVIFSQERVGRHNRTFKMYKFRTMREQTEEEEKAGWTVKGDPRVTGIGKFLRSTSLDEMPQMFNVLKGDMSLVGPRPERPQFVEKYKEEIPGYMIKHQVRPGITGWAQINGFRGNTSIRKRIDHDLYYIENWTVGFDLKIAFLTVFKGFINKNAY